MEKGSEDSGFSINKYIREDSDESSERELLNRFETRCTGIVEVSGNIGEEGFEKTRFSRDSGEYLETGFEVSDEEEFEEDKSGEVNEKLKVKKIADAKKEFFEHISDDSLSIDTCSKVSHDWKKE